MDTIKSIDLKLTRDLRFPGTASYSAAQQRLEQLWRRIADIGMILDDLLVQILCDGCLKFAYLDTIVESGVLVKLVWNL